MLPFLPIIFIMLVGFSLTFWIHERDYYASLECTFGEDEDCAQSDGFYGFLENQYKLMFADFDSFMNRDLFTILMLLFATILVPLVFLNLLIALISDAFANVMETLVRSD